MLRKTVLVIGNGFDLNCGLASSFQSFFERKLKKEGSWDALQIQKNIWYLLLAFHFFLDSDETYVEKVHPNEISWMDVESFVGDVVTKTSVSLNRDFINRRNPDHRVPSSNYDRPVSQRHELAAFFDKRPSPPGGLMAFLFSQLKAFEKDFGEYLRGEIDANPEYAEKATERLSRLKELLNSEYLFVLSFNYTDFGLLPWCIEKTVHLHGTLSQEDIIIGVDNGILTKEMPDDDDSKRASYRQQARFSKAWRKMNREYFALSSLPSLQDVEYLAFYGSSLGKQDYSYFHCLFSYYQVLNSHVKLVFYYSEFGSDENAKEEAKLKYIDNVFALLNDFAHRVLKEQEAATFVSKLQIEGRLLIKKAPF